MRDMEHPHDWRTKYSDLSKISSLVPFLDEILYAFFLHFWSLSFEFLSYLSLVPVSFIQLFFGPKKPHSFYVCN